MKYRSGLMAAGMIALVGCTQPLPPPVDGAPLSSARPLAAPKGPQPELGTLPVPQSLALQAYYTDIQTALQTQGLMRTATNPSDAKFTRAQLEENFVRIALYDEYTDFGFGFIEHERPSPLRRWNEPVRIAIHYGASVPLAQRVRDNAAIREYAARLSRASGHPVTVVPRGGNFTVYIVNEAERRALTPQLRSAVPNIGRSTVNAITNLSTSTFCVAFAFSNPRQPAYSQAVAVIRAELPTALTQSCFEEELAQGMGLANDSPTVRPSIFNDDEEFARLTRHDEMLLQILYDPRLQPGMTEDAARPIVREITAELMGPDS